MVNKTPNSINSSEDMAEKVKGQVIVIEPMEKPTEKPIEKPIEEPKKKRAPNPNNILTKMAAIKKENEQLKADAEARKIIEKPVDAKPVVEKMVEEKKADNNDDVQSVLDEVKKQKDIQAEAEKQKKIQADRNKLNMHRLYGKYLF